MKSSQKIALYAGTFDPITLGHLDIIARSLQLCDELIVVVAEGVHKTPLFEFEVRCELISESCKNAGLAVKVVPLQGLLSDMAVKHQATLLVRGLRNSRDLDFESELAEMNRSLNDHLETVFLLADTKYSRLSSTLVREVIRLKGAVDLWVPPRVLEEVRVSF